MRCQVCKQNEAEWSWQPFGPAEGGSFALPGNHYRGFPVIKTCLACKEKAQQGLPVQFSYKNNLYAFHDGTVANCTSRSGDDLPVRKADLIGHAFEKDASIVRLGNDGSLYLVHVQAWLDDGRCILFNGEIKIPLKDFKWTER